MRLEVPQRHLRRVELSERGYCPQQRHLFDWLSPALIRRIGEDDRQERIGDLVLDSGLEGERRDDEGDLCPARSEQERNGDLHDWLGDPASVQWRRSCSSKALYR
jgi:hypothetical protein